MFLITSSYGVEIGRVFRNKNLLLILVLPMILSACSSSMQISSLTPTDKVVIDGRPHEWENQLNYIEDEKCAVGFQNDNDYIYLCFETADRSKIMKILSMGVTVWLEPEDGKVLGIRFPQRMTRQEKLQRQPRNQNQQGFEDAEIMHNRINQILAKQSDLSIVNVDEFPLYAYKINDPFGFQVHLGYSMGKLIYELRIPYGSNSLAPVIIDAYPGEKIKIEFKTGEIDKSEMAQRGSGMQAGGGGMTPGGMGGGRGGMGGGRGGGKRGGEGISKLNDPFELKLDVVLAE